MRTVWMVCVHAILAVGLAASQAQAVNMTQLVETESFLAPGNAVQMLYAADRGLLFLRNSGSAIRVVDTSTHLQRSMGMATNVFADMDLTPDGQYLYASDYGGENIGYGTPYSTSYVHRFSLASGQWETKAAPNTAYRLEAVDANRFLLLTGDQWVSMSLNSWGTTISELYRGGADYRGDIEYDLANSRIIHGNSGSSSNEIHAYHLVGNSVIAQEQTGVYGTAQNGGGTSLLSSDGQNFYFGRLQVEALDVRNNRLTFPEMIYAASADVAFGQNGYYDSHTGAKLGTLPFATSVYSLDAAGTSIWAFDPTGDVLHHYAIVPEPAMLSMVVLGSGLLLIRRSRGSAASRAVGC